MSKDTDRDSQAEIEDLAKLMNQYGLEQVEISRVRGEFHRDRIKLSRLARPGAPPSAAGPVLPPRERTAAPAAAVQEPSAGALDPTSHPGAVIAPMIGTVYLQAEPGAPSFVEIGSRVEEGQTLLIIEAMKTMNHIHAPHGGTVRRILVEDTSIVEYGTPLMIIE